MLLSSLPWIFSKLPGSPALPKLNMIGQEYSCSILLDPVGSRPNLHRNQYSVTQSGAKLARLLRSKRYIGPEIFFQQERTILIAAGWRHDNNELTQLNVISQFRETPHVSGLLCSMALICINNGRDIFCMDIEYLRDAGQSWIIIIQRNTKKQSLGWKNLWNLSL